MCPPKREQGPKMWSSFKPKGVRVCVCEVVFGPLFKPYTSKKALNFTSVTVQYIENAH